MDSSYYFHPNEMQKTSSTKLYNLNVSKSFSKRKEIRFLSINEFRDKLHSQQSSLKKSNLKMNTINNNVPLSFRKTVSSFKNDPPPSTVSNFYPNSARDINAITSLYNFSGGESHTIREDPKNSNGSMILDKQLILNKYNLPINLKRSEKEDIQNLMKKDSYTKSYHKKNISTSGDIIYRSPYNSYQNLKLNQMIENQYNNMSEVLKAKAIEERFKEIKDTINKIKRMPEIRVTSKETEKDVFYLHNIEKDDDNIDSNRNNGNNKGKGVDRNELLYFATVLNNVKNKPKARKKSAIVLNKDKMWMFGGLSNEKLNDLWMIDLNECNNWVNLRPEGEIPIGCCGHTMISYKSSLYIWGGSISNSVGQKNEEIFRYDIKKSINKTEVKWRREHIAECIGDLMLIYGGLDHHDMILDDIWVLHLIYLKWERIKLNAPNLAYHSSTLVQETGRMKSSICKSKNENKFNSRKDRVEGIYIFGGKEGNGIYSNQLRVLRVLNQKPEFVNITTHGLAPSPRISSSFSFCKDHNFCVVFGGKDNRSNILKDIFLIALETMKWIEVHVYNQLPKKTCEHSAIMFNSSKLIIFGGINESIYNGSDIYLIDFEITEKKNRNKKMSTESKNGLINPLNLNGENEKNAVQSHSFLNKREILNSVSSVPNLQSISLEKFGHYSGKDNEGIEENYMKKNKNLKKI